MRFLIYTIDKCLEQGKPTVAKVAGGVTGGVIGFTAGASAALAIGGLLCATACPPFAALAILMLPIVSGTHVGALRGYKKPSRCFLGLLVLIGRFHP
jgi:hypothetical protein